MTILEQYIELLKKMKVAKDSNARDFWLWHDRAADFFNKNFQFKSQEASIAALTRFEYV